MLKTISNMAARISDGGLLVAFWALGIVVFAQFFWRYFLNMPLGWTEELARYLMIAVAFLGLPVVTRLGEHITIDLLADILPDRLRPLLLALGEAVQLAIVGVLSWQAQALAALSSQSMSALPFPKAIIYYVVLVGLILQLIASLSRLIFLSHRAVTPETRP